MAIRDTNRILAATRNWSPDGTHGERLARWSDRNGWPVSLWRRVRGSRNACKSEVHDSDRSGGIVTTKVKHPNELTDLDVDALVSGLDDAVDRGEVRVVPVVLLRELRAAASARRAAEDRIDAAVISGRRAGLSWGTIGAQLGVTRQGARQRFERLSDG